MNFKDIKRELRGKFRRELLKSAFTQKYRQYGRHLNQNEVNYIMLLTLREVFDELSIPHTNSAFSRSNTKLTNALLKYIDFELDT